MCRGQDQGRVGRVQSRLAQLRAEEMVDYAGVAAAKWPVLQSWYAGISTKCTAWKRARAREFERWCDRGGDVLRKLALYDAIQLQMRAEDPSRWGWPAWPEPLRDSPRPKSRGSSTSTPR